MPTLRLTDEQVADLVRQLPPERKRAALLALAEDAIARRDERMEYAEQQLRRIAIERGLNWDSLNDEQRQDFVDELIHEEEHLRRASRSLELDEVSDEEAARIVAEGRQKC